MGAMSLFHWLIVVAIVVGAVLWYKGRQAELADLRRRGKKTNEAPAWFLPAGVIALILGVLGFLGSAAVGGGGSAEGSLLAGLTNPLFFIGLPLGIYWLYQTRRQGVNPSRRTSPDEANPKLTHCPDCGRHVSRLATNCPHCGRPLTLES